MAYYGSQRRGTVDYLKYAVQKNELCPPYWTNRGQFWASQPVLVPVDERTKEAIKALVEETWNRHEVGRGRDAKNLSYSKLVVKNVERVENLQLFKKYATARREMMERQIRKGVVCPAVETICKSREQVATTNLLWGQKAFMKEDLYLEVNEHYLFHGTTVDRIGGLTSIGFNVGQSDSNNMFGRGIYLAEKTNKADQYADQRDARSPHGHRLKLILCRTLLGNVCAREAPERLMAPPGNFDSVIVDGRFMYREFVVYDDSRLYPEYVITYSRE
ncbi:unnamed protein product [Lymnaea stagnalis]|uniref:Poly [ADP-ribose] polymerase n=1 Tax=Lymnaea stagnalis TaxID=6523 RepID=A0AAV2HLS6_LYMST